MSTSAAQESEALDAPYIPQGTLSPPSTTTLSETRVETIGNSLAVIFGSYFGVGIRVLLTETALNVNSEFVNYLGASYFLPNVVGCFVMGWMHALDATTLPQIILLGITTGFCGCCTTFATWNTMAAKHYFHGRVIEAILVLFIGLMTSMGSFTSGIHFGKAVTCSKKSTNPSQQRDSLLVCLSQLTAKFEALNIDALNEDEAIINATHVTVKQCQATLDEIQASEAQPVHKQSSQILSRSIFGSVLLLTISFWVLVNVDGSRKRKKYWAALCFCPFGALLRWHLSKFNKTIIKFPVYTFIPNVVATVANCGLLLGQAIIDTKHPDFSHRYELWVSAGLITGFFGSLSTVSTWIRELYSLTEKHCKWAYIYGWLSIATSQVLGVLVLGIGVWVGYTIAD